MICFNCHRQIADGSDVCPNCGITIVPHEQLGAEIKIRRYQRWVLYAIIFVVFAGMAGYAVKIYLDNAALLEKMNSASEELKKANQSLSEKDSQLTDKQNQLTQLQQSSSESQKQLNQKMEEFQTALQEKISQLSQYKNFQADLGAENASVYKLIMDTGWPTSNKDLAKVALADYQFNGQDSDQDGLPDIMEEALGTDKAKADTDGDSFNDKQELIKGYDPLGSGKLPLDAKFAQSRKGSILLQAEGQGEAWYISTKDGKKYFLGRPADAIKALEKLAPVSASAAGDNNNNIEINVE